MFVIYYDLILIRIFDLNNKHENIVVRDSGPKLVRLTSFKHLRFWQIQKQIERHYTFLSVCRDTHKRPYYK